MSAEKPSCIVCGKPCKRYGAACCSDACYEKAGVPGEPVLRSIKGGKKKSAELSPTAEILETAMQAIGPLLAMQSAQAAETENRRAFRDYVIAFHSENPGGYLPSDGLARIVRAISDAKLALADEISLFAAPISK